MRPNPVIAKKGETPARMVCAVTGKPVQSGATAVSLSETHWVYVNPGKSLTEERVAQLLELAAADSPTQDTASKEVASKVAKKAERES